MLKIDVISLEPEKNENRKWCKIFGLQYIIDSYLPQKILNSTIYDISAIYCILMHLPLLKLWSIIVISVVRIPAQIIY